MSKIAVVFHSGYGHTLRMAQAVAEGANATLVPIDAEGNLADGAWDTLNAADAIVMGSPTYMGSVSWQFKKFADASSKPWFAQAWKDKLFAGFTNSATMNGDKLSTLHYLFTLAMQHGGIWVGTGMMPSNRKAAERNDVNYVGSFSGAMAQSPSDSSPDEMLPGDLETARLFGQRVAEIAGKWQR
jgi:multimeric flavodoxin WrbA